MSSSGYSVDVDVVVGDCRATLRSCPRPRGTETHTDPAGTGPRPAGAASSVQTPRHGVVAVAREGHPHEPTSSLGDVT